MTTENRPTDATPYHIKKPLEFRLPKIGFLIENIEGSLLTFVF